MLSLKILKTSLDGFSPDVSLKSKIGPWTYFCYCGLTPLVISFFIWIYLIYFLTLVIFLFISSSRCFSYLVVLIYIFCCYTCVSLIVLEPLITESAQIRPRFHSFELRLRFLSPSVMRVVLSWMTCMSVIVWFYVILLVKLRFWDIGMVHCWHTTSTNIVKQPDQHLQSHAYSLSRYPSGFFLALHCFYVVYLNKWPWSILTEPVCCNMRSRLPM